MIRVKLPLSEDYRARLTSFSPSLERKDWITISLCIVEKDTVHYKLLAITIANSNYPICSCPLASSAAILGHLFAPVLLH